MTILWEGEAIPAPDGEDGVPRVFFSAEEPGTDVPAPLYRVTIFGPEDGKVDIPDHPVPVWWTFGYEHLPLGYSGQVERIK